MKRVVVFNRFQNGIPEESLSSQELSAEDLEVQLVLFLHGEFIRFVRMLRSVKLYTTRQPFQIKALTVLSHPNRPHVLTHLRIEPHFELLHTPSSET